MLELEQAQQRILTLVSLLQLEPTPLHRALGRYLGQKIFADADLPPFDNSAMDGYAVQAADVAQAGLESPVELQLIGRVPAGQTFSGSLARGQAVRVFTGSPLPQGADAVVMQEDTRVDATQPDRLLVLDASRPWENVRFRGEDVKRGAAVALEGDLVTPSRMALLAATGCAEAMTRRRPVVGLIATGTELKEGGASLGPGQIYESNRVTLAGLARQAGAEPKIYPLVGDELSAIKSLLVQALSECDAVVSSGGVSVGELDLVKPAFEAIGGELQFWKVAIKPGKPFVLGQRQGKLFFGLPGNPVSAFVTFLLLVRPALLRFQGSRAVSLTVRPGIMAEHVSNTGDRRHFIRVNLSAGGQVRSSGRQASHLLNSLVDANGLLDLPPGTAVETGRVVQVLAWD